MRQAVVGDLRVAVSRILRAALALWVARWLLIELAALAGNRGPRGQPPSLDSERPPGWMPLRREG